MNKRTTVLLSGTLAFPLQVWAASAATGVSPTGSILKMVLGLVVVLAVMAFVSWGVKRMLPSAMGQQSAIRIVGGVSVGSRERVVVLEVADRWIVVGVAPGQVNGIANLEVGETQLSEQLANRSTSNPDQTTHQVVHPLVQPLVKPFSEWLKKSSEAATTKLGRKPDVKE